jgi:site-specific DNA recombinase
MAQLRKTLENEETMDEFDRVVFESIVEKVIVGGDDEDGNPTPYKLTFILKCDQNLNIMDAKADYKANHKKERVS